MLEIKDIVDDEINRAGLSEAEASFVRETVMERLSSSDDTETEFASDRVIADEVPVDSSNFYRAQQLAQEVIEELN